MPRRASSHASVDAALATVCAASKARATGSSLLTDIRGT
jgi:hypothetical protein